MKTLEDYLAGDYRSDVQEIAALSRALEEAAATFVATFDANGSNWPYEYKKNEQKIVGSDSQGTWAMVLCAVGKLLGECNVDGRTELVEDNALAANWVGALDALIEHIAPQRGSGRKRGFRSNTFGKNNAMTISHVAELYSVLEGKKANFDSRIKSILNKGVESLIKLPESVETNMFPNNKDGLYRPSGFVISRLLRSAIYLEFDPLPVDELRKYFESGLHDQLSFSAIPDSRFDPAEMLFCLEGLLLCAPEAVDAVSFHRILEVLADKQNSSAHWRPNKPFLSSKTGSIMLPLSIECANSLMRSVTIMDRHRTHDLFAAKTLPLLHRFWSWLEARSVRFTPKTGAAKDRACIGWHSEHVNEPDIIHIWDTSQVVEFMIAYRTMLYKNVARTTLDLSGVKERYPEPLGNVLPPPLDGRPRHDWNDVVADREPILGGQAAECIYAKVDRYFIAPRDKRKTGKPYYSMLLYGPPGTGKSTLAELMADALGWRMLTVTVSDFLGSGGAMVEARAKAIFKMLETQSDVVILFDELDSFLLDRDSKFYREQENLFKFLTPGMLTKINDLRSAKRSIFIVATNYANRIDPAIKRVGRIDHKLLLLPPDLARREKMIEKAWAQESAKQPAGSPRTPLKASEVTRLAKAFCYAGWNDISDMVKDMVRSGQSLSAVLDRIRNVDRSTGPTFYGRRFATERPFKDQIGDEVLWLYRLADECGDDEPYISGEKFKEKFVKSVCEVDGDAAIEEAAEKLMEGFTVVAGEMVQ